MKIDSVSGWIFLDKPIGITSNNALQKVKNLFGNCKAGYVGTLDPLASGFLPIALGKSTKTIKYMSNYNKEYIFEIRWGSQSSTGDFEGQVKKTSNRIPTKNEILKAVKIFGSDYYQTPPKYSAKKINGTKAYELVRKNVDFELKKQKKKIFNLNVLDFFSDGKTSLAPFIAIGTIEILPALAIIKLPRLNIFILPSVFLVPSGKEITFLPSLIS